MRTRASQFLSLVVLTSFLVVGLACSKAPSDAELAGSVQSRFSQDSGLASKTLNVQAANGRVTLSGSVDNEMQRDAAARQAAAVPGVKDVVNNLQVMPSNTEAASQAPAPVEEKPTPAAAPVTRPRPSKAKPRPAETPSHVAQNHEPATPAAVSPAPAQAMPAAPPEPPKPQKVTIPSGTTLAVRLVDAVDSETAQDGQSFHATLDSPLSLEGDVVIPSGYDVTGHVVQVQSAGKFAGKSLLVLQLDRIGVGSKSYSIQTDQYRREGSSRTKNTAAKVGTGAAIGAIIGGIAGGGKGAAIGAAAGGGLGGGVQAATKGQQIQLPSETVLNFTLQAPVTVLPAEPRHSNRQKLPEPDSDSNQNKNDSNPQN
jgi:outer membrane biosynthesis protein TonB